MPLGLPLVATRFLDGMFTQASFTEALLRPFSAIGAPESAVLPQLSVALGQWADASSWLGAAGIVTLAVALVLSCTAAWSLNLIALPGNWIAVALLALYAWLVPAGGRLDIGLGSVAWAFGFAVLGELVEFFAGAVGARKAGASRRSAAYSLIGSICGAVLGAILGLPIPVVGQVLAAILFGGLGATAGAMYGEWTSGRPWRENWAIGHSAFWGRTFGTLGKTLVGVAIVLIALGGVLL